MAMAVLRKVNNGELLHESRVSSRWRYNAFHCIAPTATAYRAGPEPATIRLTACLVIALQVLVNPPQRIIEFVQSLPLHSGTIVRSGFVAFNALAHVLTAARSHEGDDPGRPQDRGRWRLCQSDPERTMSVSELSQIISAFVIVCGVLAAAVIVVF